jgi:hypothetical protein
MRAALLLLLGTLGSWPAMAVEVNLCGSDTQAGPGTNLASAIAAGGYITFRCPQATIAITTSHELKPGTTIDGGSSVILDAHNAHLTIFTSAGAVTLKRITIQNARQKPPFLNLTYPSILRARGNATLDQVTIQGSQSPVGVEGSGEVKRSRFFNNSGSTLYLKGVSKVEDSSFMGNQVGLSMKAGELRGGVVSQNSQVGLSIRYPTGALRVIGVRFERNQGRGAIDLSQRSQSGSDAVVEIRGSKFLNNSGSSGGAISILDTTADFVPAVIIEALRRFPPARFVIAFNRFEGNRGVEGGAIHADLANSKGMLVKGGLFIANEASGFGGAIAWTNGPMLVTQSFFKANKAGQGAALYGRPGQQGGSAALVNSLIVENSPSAGEAAIDVSRLAILNSTIASNQGFGLAADGSGPIELKNVIVSRNTAGNCRGFNAGAAITSSLQFGSTDCPAMLVADPELDTLYVPAAGSPAHYKGDLGTCRNAPVSSLDILFQSRAMGAGCSIGAYEQAPVKRIALRREEGPPRPQEPDRRAMHAEAPAADDTPALVRNEVAGAIAASEAAASARTDYTWTLGSGIIKGMFERVPGRSHLLLVTEDGKRQESIVIGVRLFSRADGAWRETSAAPFTGTMPSMDELFKTNFTSVRVEISGPIRTYIGRMAWPAPKGASSGEYRLSVGADGRPREAAFSGTCWGRPCTFHQSYSFDSPIQIEQPPLP